MNRPARPTTGRTRDNELRIGIDIDGTIARWLAAFERRLRILDPRFKVIDALAYNVFHRYSSSPEHIQEALDTVDYLGIELIPFAREAIAEMSALGHHPVFVTAPTPTHPTCVDDKREWIEDNFGPRMAEEAIIEIDKTLVTGLDIIMEDNPALIELNAELDTEVVAFLRSYNRRAARQAGVRGFSAWSQYKSVLREVA